MQNTLTGLDRSILATRDDVSPASFEPIQMADLPRCCADPELGLQIYNFIADVYPICRSITGDGVRETLSAIERLIDLERHEVPTGTPVLDWTIPKEWNIRDAYVANSLGERIIDFHASCLHVVGYSMPVNGRF